MGYGPHGVPWCRERLEAGLYLGAGPPVLSRGGAPSLQQRTFGRWTQVTLLPMRGSRGAGCGGREEEQLWVKRSPSGSRTSRITGHSPGSAAHCHPRQSTHTPSCRRFPSVRWRPLLLPASPTAWVAVLQESSADGHEWGADGAWMGRGWGLDRAWMGPGWRVDGAQMGCGWGADEVWMGRGWGVDGAWVGKGPRTGVRTPAPGLCSDMAPPQTAGTPWAPDLLLVLGHSREEGRW